MTVAEVTAAPGITGVAPSDNDVTLEFGGRFRLGIDQWAYVPFDVPTGVRRITVSTAHDQFSLLGVARNVLDLGIFGPAGYQLGNVDGFRGWSGGARSGFTLSAGDATPGYLAGPIDPGRWALALGPVVLNPLGMRWRAQIVLQYGAPAPVWARDERLREEQKARDERLREEQKAPDERLREEQTAPDERLREEQKAPDERLREEQSPVPHVLTQRGRGWYRGDLHLHTVHSDGSHETGDLVDSANAARLDFIVSTEHNTSAANREWVTPRTDGLLVVSGEEVTTRHGHWLAVGLPPGGWVDWRYAPGDNAFPHFAAQVRAGGGMVVAAHPAVPMPGSAWEFGYRHVDAVEVWNGGWNVDDEVSLRIWHRLLRRGRLVAAVGGSDSHGPHQRVGLPQTVVHAAELSTSALVDALRCGRSYIAESDDVTVSLAASCTGCDEALSSGPGDTLSIPSDAAVTVSAAVCGAPGSRLALITASGCVATVDVDRSGTGRLAWTTTGAAARFVRVEVRRPARGRIGPMVALSNPVLLTSH